MSFFVLLPDGETSYAHVLRDIVDNEDAEPGVREERQRQGGIDEECDVVWARLDDRWSRINI